jgi:Predicted chitinase
MMNIRKALGVVATLLFAGHAYAYNCSGVAQYSDGASYSNGSIVQNLGIAYQCTVGGWCSVGGPYAPGAGWAWDNAWTSLGSCGSTGGPVSSSSSSSGNNNGGGSCPNWSAGTFYDVGAVVRYNNGYFRAKNANPGYDPLISTWFWEPVASCPGGNNNSSSSSNGGNNGGSCPQWSAGTDYYAGNVVIYNGSYYIAEHDNPGYDPTISTWFWEPVASCPGGNNNSSSSSGNGGSGFAAIVSEAQFNQMFPNRNPFYTYSGLVAATNNFPAFANTGDLQVRKREAAAALANFSHETGGLVHINEIARGEYCSGTATPCGVCAPGKQYHGRGPIQLSWNYNYCAAGQALGLNLWGNPDLVAQDPTVAWGTAIWFWMTQSGSGYRPAHTSITGGYGFGETIRTINGSLECNGGHPGQVQSRINLYQNFIQILGGTPGNNLGC